MGHYSTPHLAQGGPHQAPNLAPNLHSAEDKEAGLGRDPLGVIRQTLSFHDNAIGSSLECEEAPSVPRCPSLCGGVGSLFNQVGVHELQLDRPSRASQRERGQAAPSRVSRGGSFPPLPASRVSRHLSLGGWLSPSRLCLCLHAASPLGLCLSSSVSHKDPDPGFRATPPSKRTSSQTLHSIIKGSAKPLCANKVPFLGSGAGDMDVCWRGHNSALDTRGSDYFHCLGLSAFQSLKLCPTFEFFQVKRDCWSPHAQQLDTKGGWKGHRAGAR